MRGAKGVYCDHCSEKINYAHRFCKNFIKKTESILSKFKMNKIQCSIYSEREVNTYQVSIAHCYKCNEEIPVFSFGEFWSTSTPPEPKPRTLKYAYSKELGRAYWMNICAKCGAKQGDFYLYFLKIKNSQDVQGIEREFGND